MVFFKNLNLNKILTIIVFILLVLIVIFRAPNILLEPRFWAEEGSVYYAHAMQSGILEGIFLAPKGTAGYLLLAASFPATFAANFSPIEFAPFITTYFSLSVLLLVFFLVLWGKSYFWNTLTLKIATCLIILFIPSSNSSGEIWLNTINLQVYCGLIALIIALENTTIVTNTKKWLLRLVLFFCILSGVYTIFLTPLYYVKYYYERSQESLIHLSIIMFGSIVQISIFAYIKYLGLISAKKMIGLSWAKSSIYVFYHHILHPLFGHTIANQLLDNIGLKGALTVDNGQYLLLAGYVSLIAILVPIFLLLLRRTNYVNVQLSLGFLLLAVLTSIFAMGGVPGGRYAVLSSIIYGLLILRIVSSNTLSMSGKYVARFILICFILIGAYEFQFNTKPMFTGSDFTRPDWRAEVDNWKKDSNLSLPMWPYPRWTGKISPSGQVDALRKLFNNTNDIYLESDGKWDGESLILPPYGMPSVFSLQFDVENKKCNAGSVLQILLLGELNQSMQWVAFDLSGKCSSQNFQISVDSKIFNKKGNLTMSNANEIVFRLKGIEGAASLKLSNIQYKSPYQAF
jgi:hypothetical protein